MNKLRAAFFLLSIIFIFSCNDSGVVTPQNKGTFSVTRLEAIDKNVVGTYELWGSLITANFDHDENAFRSMGRFAISITGSVTDTSGNPFTPNLGKISNINNVGDIIITIQPPGYNDTIPSNIKILGGAKQLIGSEIVFDLTMSYEDILPSSAQFGSSSADFILASPTTGTASSQYQKGIWFTKDTSGSTAGITLPTLPDTADWTYQAWIIDNSNSSNIYNIGRFDNPSAGDNNQQCQLSGGLTWAVPGHDWLQANCPGGGVPDIVSLNNNYRVLISLEPRYEQGTALSVPFYLTLFTGNISAVSFGSIQGLSNSFSQVVPTAQVRLSAN
ncbi:MAG: hypothetical protein ABI543_02880 [Ignavibacteria bacterium]